jgi:hypothetical protein
MDLVRAPPQVRLRLVISSILITNALTCFECFEILQQDTRPIYIDRGISGLCPTTQIRGSAKLTIGILFQRYLISNRYEWRTEIG